MLKNMKFQSIILVSLIAIMSCTSSVEEKTTLTKPSNKTNNTFAQSKSVNNEPMNDA